MSAVNGTTLATTSPISRDRMLLSSIVGPLLCCPGNLGGGDFRLVSSSLRPDPDSLRRFNPALRNAALGRYLQDGCGGSEPVTTPDQVRSRLSGSRGSGSRSWADQPRDQQDRHRKRADHHGEPRACRGQRRGAGPRDRRECLRKASRRATRSAAGGNGFAWPGCGRSAGSHGRGRGRENAERRHRGVPWRQQRDRRRRTAGIRGRWRP